MTRSCELYLENPEQNREHLAECESCRRLESWLNVSPDVPVKKSAIGDLPVAPWEGAGHRAWGLAAAAAIVVLLGAAAFFFVAGVSPIQGFAAALREIAPRVDFITVASSFAELLKGAPAMFHIVVITAFIVVNLIFALLLRRPAKGYDTVR